MRPEKQYLVEELNSHLDKSDYVYLTNYERITVEEIAELRAQLSEHDAEFHVVKNSIFGVAAASKDLPDMGEHLTGQTAIIVGGNNPSGVAKVIGEFFKKKDKVEMKAGIVNERALTKEEIEALAKLPGLEVLRAQLLSLLTQPATGFVRVINAVPQGLVNVLQAKVRKENGE
ncbi:MAG: 50S ribosomal protein L10 [Opitutales bacterium]|jgi:large subunit ribosomal protein L10|nr:50S ribosomal protein L10 [Opitutales bacterium]MDP4643007.1 50S ribosomal protein L10 [Opitutales bacterium]MDP4777950.1 50S ribosomal protein L10 [Opitutales bacterium]MDP4882810.1 50S ribosomal protein L10 [Opitutales bacterium]MDP5080492.1 50S ribosomal protein L10 [Opitutales bacterium]